MTATAVSFSPVDFPTGGDRAPFLWTVVAGDDGRCGQVRAEGKVLKVGKDGNWSRPSSRERARSTRIAPARTTPVRRDLARRKIYAVAADGTAKTFSIPTTSTLGAGGRSQRCVFAPPRQGRDLQDHAGRSRVSLLQDQRHQCCLARVCQIGWLPPVRNRPTCLPDRRHWQGVRAADSPFKEIHALRVADDGTLYAAAVTVVRQAAVVTIARSIAR